MLSLYILIFQEKFGPNSDSGTPSDAEGPEVSMGEATPVESFTDSSKEPGEAGEEARGEVTQVEEMVSSWTGGQVESMEGRDTPEEDTAMEDADEIISVTVVSEDSGDLAEGAGGVSDEAASEPVEAAHGAKLELAPSEAMGEEVVAAKEEAEEEEAIEEMSEEGAGKSCCPSNLIFQSLRDSQVENEILTTKVYEYFKIISFFQNNLGFFFQIFLAFLNSRSRRSTSGVKKRCVRAKESVSGVKEKCIGVKEKCFR